MRTEALHRTIIKLEEEVTERKKGALDVRKSLERERELNELKSKFVTIASHEFRTPLSAVLSSAALINQYNVRRESDKIHKHVQRIKSSVNQLTGILNDFLSLGKLEEGKVDIVYESVNPTLFLNEVKEEVGGIALMDTQLIQIPKHDFITMLQSPEMSKKFIALLCRKISEKENQLINIAYNSVRQRTAEALLKASPLKDTNENISISREDLAKMVATASESVIRVLSDFREEGLIEMEGTKFKILSDSKLEKVIRWNVSR